MTGLFARITWVDEYQGYKATVDGTSIVAWANTIPRVQNYICNHAYYRLNYPIDLDIHWRVE